MLRGHSVESLRSLTCKGLFINDVIIFGGYPHQYPSPIPHVILSSFGYSPPCPSSDEVIYEQPLKHFEVNLTLTYSRNYISRNSWKATNAVNFVDRTYIFFKDKIPKI